jgi:sugar/nucleoside kinase (ribokinase family)
MSGDERSSPRDEIVVPGRGRGDHLVVIGELMVDVVVRPSGPPARASDTPARISFAGGGSGANVAAWAAWLGAPVALVCRVGADERGLTAVEALRAAGVDVRAIVDGERPTGTCVALVEPGGERTMLPDPGANDAPAEFPDDLTARHLHVSGYSLLRPAARPGALAAIERARAAGMTVSIDPASWALIRPGLIPPADLLLPNEEEAAVLSGHDDPAVAAHELVGGDAAAHEHVRGGGAAPEVIVKLGEAGALWTDGNKVVRAPAEPVEVVDTIGAGDAFAAGFLVARLRGAGPREALAAGCATAARAVSRAGARP